MLALAACAAPKKSSLPPDFGREPAPVSQVEGVVTDRATGKPLVAAEIYFGSDTEGYPTDGAGRYSGLVVAGATRAHIVYLSDDGGVSWMTTAPFEVAPYELTMHDFAFTPEPCHMTRDDSDVDRVFELALVEHLGNRHDRRLRIVDYRRRSSGNSVSVGGIDLTTRAVLQDESDRSDKTIDYVHVDAELESACAARVTIGHSCVAPHESAFDCDEGQYWLYVKDASGWHRLTAMGGYAT